MTRKLAFTLPAALALALWVPSLADAQHTRNPDSGGSTGTAVPRDSGGSSSGGGSSGGTVSGGGGSVSAPSGQGGSSGGRAVPRSGASRTGSGRSGQARPRGGSSDEGGTRAGGSTSATGSSGNEDADRVPPYSRPRGDRPATGQAVERRPGSPGGGPYPIIIDGGGYYGGFYPWGWGGLGFGGYYGGFYDPWWYDPYPTNYSYGYEGSLRLKIKPRSASVYVDGYFAGQVDDYDGVFQRLRIDSGPHRIEVREEGYEPLTFEVRIQPDRTITYKGELNKLP